MVGLHADFFDEERCTINHFALVTLEILEYVKLLLRGHFVPGMKGVYFVEKHFDGVLDELQVTFSRKKLLRLSHSAGQSIQRKTLGKGFITLLLTFVNFTQKVLTAKGAVLLLPFVHLLL